MKNMLRVAAFGAVVSLAASTVPAMASMIGFAGAQDQNQNYNHDQNQNHDQAQHQNYSNNPYYKQGTNDGYSDYKHKTHKEHQHKYPSEADRQAYQYGYQQGLQGHHGDSDDNHPHP